MRDFSLLIGGRPRIPKEQEHLDGPPVSHRLHRETIDDLVARHEAEVGRLSRALDRALDALGGHRWGPENSLHVLVNPNDHHSLKVGGRIDVRLSISNASPFNWVVMRADCSGIYWEREHSRRHPDWSPVPAEASVPSRPALVGGACGLSTSVTLRVTGELPPAPRGTIDLYVERLRLLVRREDSGEPAWVPVRLSEGPIRLLPPESS